MGWIWDVLRAIVGTIIIFSAVAFIAVMFGVLLERKISAWMQSRLGPKHVGPQGLLQTVADTIKLLQKENIVPSRADRLIFASAVIVVPLAALLDYVVIPFGTTRSGPLIFRDLNIGVLYFAATSSLVVVGILMAGWGSNNKYALLGGMRSAAQMVTYEIPIGLALVTVALMAGSLSTVTIVNGQARLWYIVTQPVAFLIFLVAATAEVNRVPFDLVEAESELVAGYFSEYSGMRFALFQLGEYGEMFAMAAMAVTLFLGGWRGPVLPPVLWFVIKLYALIFVFMWVRWTYPRFRIDQMLNFSWKILIPVSVLNLVVTAFFAVVVHR
ncbi:MAG TPA: NADH-quinone oxidoreductase subunit NuoH [bacterium]|jgi:NADH-quinone oxidoreductase subunit H|nr:NADH-quinone oxidoreductase subunit NuoH [bacterium]